MLSRSSLSGLKKSAGFTLIELLIAITLMSIIGLTFLVFFKSTLFNYIDLQSDASALTELDTQAARIANVVRGLTDISSVDANDLVLYSYFYPSDTYVSQVHYYLQTTGSDKQLMADVTPMSANPPNGTLLTAKKRTFVVIDNFYQATSTSLFTYLDSSGSTLTLPITDLQTIKAVQVNLATKTTIANQAINLQVSLRNRKTNL